ncbi:MAG: nodulation protein NfeD [Ardenticatenaceae bacterium]|nr:nodulation protein NfeD [Ardenticatenaceae bacterium]
MWRIALLNLWVLLCAIAWQQVQAQDGSVLVLEIEGPVTPAMASYFERGIAAAEETGATAVLIVLDTPGGNLDPTQDIVQLLRTSSVPVIVYIGPRGAQAASAGSIITLAAHASGMAPETVIGAASPVGDGGAELEETISRKLIEDLRAQVRGLAARRGEAAVALAEEMIEDARAVTADEALEIGLIDVVAVDIPDLLRQLDGRVVLVDGSEVALATAVARQQPFAMNFLEQILQMLANPLLVSVLFAIGAQAILIELSSPGGWVAGFIGVLALALGLYGAGQLPVNWLGLGLIVVAFALFAAEALATNHGALGVTGAVTLLAGLLVLFNSPGSPEFARISVPGAVGVSVITAAFFIFVAMKAMAAQKRQPRTGAEGLLGQTALVRKAFATTQEAGAYAGMVLVNGELWQARAEEPIAAGEKVAVTAVSGLLLTVKRQQG